MSEKMPGFSGNKPIENDGGMNRRDVLKLGAISLAALAIPSSENNKEVRETSEFFIDEISSYSALYGSLRRNQILFVDDRNRPIGKPVSLIPIGEIKAGNFDKHGLIESDINQAWLRAARRKICTLELEGVTCDDNESLPRQHNAIPAIRRAVAEGLNPGTILDVVTYYGTKETIGGGGLNRIEYVQNMEIKGVPTEVQDEIRRVIIGLPAQESSYHNGLESPVGAKGIFQFMPDTWKELGFDESDILLLTNQVDAAEKYFARTYRNLQDQAGDALTSLRTELFDDNENNFNKYFVVPVMLNSYNAGNRRMTEAVTWFESNYGTKAKFEKTMGRYRLGAIGYDVFYALTKTVQRVNKGVLANYGKDASEYVPRIYAFADLLEGKY